MVEFAIILPLLLLLIFGAIEFGFIFYDLQVLTNASREGARYGIVSRSPRYTASEITSQVGNYCGSSLISFSSNNGTAPSTKVTCSSGGSACSAGSQWQSASGPESLTVQVTYVYDFLVFPSFANNFFGGTFDGTLTLTKAATMNCE